jgi:hypothetical protein
VISHQATRANLACQRGQVTADAQEIIQTIDTTCQAIEDMWYTVPSTAGGTFRNAVGSSIRNLACAIRIWSVSLRDALGYQGSSPDPRAPEVLMRVGVVWRTCEQLQHLPKDNTDAVLKHWDSMARLVEDAVEEFAQALKEDEARKAASSNTSQVDQLTNQTAALKLDSEEAEDEVFDMKDRVLTEEEVDACRRCLTCARLVKMLLRKIEQRCLRNPSLSGTVSAEWQDELLSTATQLPEAVDELGAVFWERVSLEETGNTPEVIAQMRSDTVDRLGALRVAFVRLANLAKSQLTEEHQNWIQSCIAQFDAQRRALCDL